MYPMALLMLSALCLAPKCPIKRSDYLCNFASLIPGNSIQLTILVSVKVYGKENRSPHGNSDIARSTQKPRSRGPLPLENLLQRFPGEGAAVLEDVVEGVQGTELPALLLVVDLGGCRLGQLQGFRLGLVSSPWHATHVFRFGFRRGPGTPRPRVPRKEASCGVSAGFLRSTLFPGVHDLCFVTGEKGLESKGKTIHLFSIEK